MNPKDIIEYCLKKSGAFLDFPFGAIPAVIKVCGKIFAEVYPNEGNCKITLKCDPFLAEAYRTQYPGIVIPGYHVPSSQKKYRNTIYLDQGIPDEIILRMIDHSYTEVIKKLKKEEKKAIGLL